MNPRTVITRALRTRSRRLLAVGAASTVALAGAGYAYFTTTGSGTGSASVGTSSAIVLHGSTSGTLYPGSNETVSFTADNPSNAHQQVGTIHLASVAACSVNFPGGTCPSGDQLACTGVETGTSDTNTANFWMPDVTSNQDLAPSTNGQTLTATGTLTMNDTSSNQNACENAYLQLSFSS